MSRPTQITLSCDNLLHNFSVIRAFHPQCKMIAMVKANAYGHGIRSVSKVLEHHVEYLGVASIDEAIALRKAGITACIILMEGIFSLLELPEVHRYRLCVVFQTLDQWEWFKKNPVSLQAWMKIDTGMGRLGFTLEEAERVYREMCSYACIEQPIGILSHFSCADLKDHPMNNIQYKKFYSFLEGKSVIKSLENSAACLYPIGGMSDVIRPGLLLYGCSPFPEQSAQSLGLKPVMSLQSHLIRVFEACPGQTLGYGGRYVCKEPMLVGVVAVGYGDGYPITIRDGAPVLVNGTRCEIAGRISMDMLTVDLRALGSARVGDPVVLWGEDLPLEEVVEYAQQHVWSVLTGIQNRVRSCWV